MDRIPILGGQGEKTDLEQDVHEALERLFEGAPSGSLGLVMRMGPDGWRIEWRGHNVALLGMLEIAKSLILQQSSTAVRDNGTEE